jgi:hypothetical protein
VSVALRLLPPCSRASWSAGGGGLFTNLTEHILSTPPQNVFFDTTATNANAFFYRIKVE